MRAELYQTKAREKCISARDREGRTIWIADAHRGDGKGFTVRADEKLPAFLNLNQRFGLWEICVDGFVPLSKLDAVWNRGQGRKLFSRSFLPLFQICTAKGPSAGDKLDKEK